MIQHARDHLAGSRSIRSAGPADVSGEELLNVISHPNTWTKIRSELLHERTGRTIESCKM